MLGTALSAQNMQFFYPAPPASAVEVSKDQAYGALQMDVYRPRSAAGKALPALVFFNIASGAQRSNPFYKAWRRLPRPGILSPSFRICATRSFEQDFDALMAHLASNAAN